jgi:glutamate racemase
MTSASPIGIFDSGVGGLSVLRHIRAQLPNEQLLYFADSACAPYGDKPEAMLAARALAIADFLVAQGAKALVVACNTATVAAIAALRTRYPLMPLVGVEPGLKPAAAATRNGKVGVMATEGTLAGAKFLLLRDQISATSTAQFLLQGCPGLADQIESGQLDSEATVAMLERFILPLLAQGADTLVLGCTHYPFVLDAIAAIVARAGAQAGVGAPAHGVVLIDTGEAVARQLARLLAAAGLLRADDGEPARLDGYASAQASALALAFTRLLGVDAPVLEVCLPSPAAQIAALHI